MEMADKRLETLNRRRRETCPASDLVVGLQCGGSDAFSGVTANPAVGFAADLLVRAGATVMFSEVTEVRDAIHLLTRRAVNEDVARALIREMAWYDDYLAMGKVDRSANTSPGNKKGGLANIVEKALGSSVKSGSSPIAGVLAPGERATTKGMIFAATPASDFVCGTLQLASGMTLEVFTTGRGTPYSLAAAPVIKVSTRTDSPSGGTTWTSTPAASPRARPPSSTWAELFRLMLDVASGRKKPWSDRWGSPIRWRCSIRAGDQLPSDSDGIVGRPFVMVGVVPTVHPSPSSGACGWLDPRAKPEDDRFLPQPDSTQTGKTFAKIGLGCLDR
jgi:galactarate dehydratase